MQRITVTITDELTAAVHQYAEDMDRSRSWVVREALRQFLSRRGYERISQGHWTDSPRKDTQPKQ